MRGQVRGDEGSRRPPTIAARAGRRQQGGHTDVEEATEDDKGGSGRYPGRHELSVVGRCREMRDTGDEHERRQHQAEDFRHRSPLSSWVAGLRLGTVVAPLHPSSPAFSTSVAAIIGIDVDPGRRQA